MIVSDGKIVEITERELFGLWLKQGMDDILSFPDYIESFRAAGCVVKGGGGLDVS